MKIAYLRVSTEGQNLDRQLDGVAVDRTYTDKITGASNHRPGLDAMIHQLRPDDEVFVHSLDRLARSLSSLKEITDRITETGASLTFVKERMTFAAGDKSPLNALMFHILGSFAEFERDMIRSRAREGIDRAKLAGRYRGGQPKLSSIEVDSAYSLVMAGQKIVNVAKLFGVTRPTLYSYLRKRGYVSRPFNV